ncbi:BQ5605_C007g04672 [Microbotryum silenes-dioicae]|uniref:BQ5605_C007g04672 protein n=1 Tax=Microbotryum silenes-dioicae TaxID=796604 RepID=A0A2X0PA06_9BASI|nr:BQ5605_C007g04672 [Microbotryum silenes-dioicae]
MSAVSVPRSSTDPDPDPDPDPDHDGLDRPTLSSNTPPASASTPAASTAQVAPHSVPSASSSSGRRLSTPLQLSRSEDEHSDAAVDRAAAGRPEQARPSTSTSTLTSTPISSTTSHPPTPPTTSTSALTSQQASSCAASTSSNTTSTSASKRRDRSTSRSRQPAYVYAVLLVAFDHLQGPIIEFGYPQPFADDAYLNSNLPFLALPDGAHAREEDYSYFHMLNPLIAPETLFGISCNRQIQADELLKKGKDVTRSTVQKAIVVLANKVGSNDHVFAGILADAYVLDRASQPIFGPLRDKLGVITRTFFAQRNFEDKSILVDLYSSFEIQQPSPISSPKLSEGEAQEREDAGMYMGTSLRELVYRFRSKTLMLVKLLMLQKKVNLARHSIVTLSRLTIDAVQVMFYAANSPVETLCTMQYSLVALIPSLLTHLDDASSPDLDALAQTLTKPTSLKTSDRSSLVRYLGLPLNIFGKVSASRRVDLSVRASTDRSGRTQGSFFQPYLPLQQIDLLQARSFLVGTTNSIFQQQRDCPIDVLVRLESATLEVLDPKLSYLISLTAADRKWMDEIVSTVDNSYDPADPSRPVGMNFIGSEDFLRAKFEEYICSLLACIKFTEFLKQGDKGQTLLSGNEMASYNVESFNDLFVRAFKATPAFAVWNRTTDDAIFDLVEPKHPMEGKTNPIEDVGIRLAHGLHDLHLPENLAPTKEMLSRGVQQGSESIWGAYSFLKSDITKRQKEYNERRTNSISGSIPASPPVLDMAGNTLLAGVDVAKTGVATVATGIGSFLASRRVSGLFSGPKSPTTTTNESNSRSLTGTPKLATQPPSPLDLRKTTDSPSNLAPFLGSGASPAPPGSGAGLLPSPGISGYLRPLSTASSATTPPLTPPIAAGSNNATPAAGGGAGGFFSSVNPLSLLSRARSPEITSSTSTSSTFPPTPSDRPIPLKELELGQELMPRDLDKEYAAKQARSERRQSAKTVPVQLEFDEGAMDEERLKELEQMTDEELTRAGVPGAAGAGIEGIAKVKGVEVPTAPKLGGEEWE